MLIPDVISSFSAAMVLANMPLGGEAWPPHLTGADLMAACDSKELEAQGLCAGYIRGVADVLGGPGAKVDGILACLPGGETNEQVVTLVKQYLNDNPQLGSLKADGLVAYVLSLSFPCE